MNKIILPCIFGKKSKDTLMPYNASITLTLDETFLITRTVYKYETPIIENDEMSGYKINLANEKNYMLKSMINAIGVGYDNDMDVYFLSFCVAGINSYINVESAEKGNELLNQLIEWWKS